jgi:membrane-associated protease RseP (regulator of RpoE activity)
MRKFVFVVVPVLLAAGIASAAGDTDSTAAKKGWLGVYTQSLSEPMLAALGIEHGVLVTGVADESPAAEAGFQVGDVITRLADETIEDPADLRRAVRHRPGQKVEVAVRRRGSEKSLSATLEAKPRGESQVDFEWRDLPGEAVKETRKVLRLIGPEAERELSPYRGTLESIRRELDALRQQLDSLREELRKKD